MYLSDRLRPDVEPGVRRRANGRVGSTVVLMGLVSMLTDISSESLSAVFPLYVTAVLGLSPLAYGFIDGLYQGVSALVRLLGGWLSDRADRPKWVAFVGYGLSAGSKALLIPLQSFAALTAIVSVDRIGKGIRTAPRDAIIAAATRPDLLGRAFGVHRALDTLGAVIGPLLAFLMLWLVPGDYTAVFVASFAAALLGLAVLGLLVPDLRPRRAEGRAVRPPPLPSLRELGSAGMRRLLVVSGLLGLLTISDGFLYLSLQQRDDFAALYFPLLFVGTNLTYLALAVPFGRLADRVGRAKVLIGGHLFLVGAYLFAAGAVTGLSGTVACLALLGAFYAATDGVLSALTSTLVPTSLLARGLATTQTVVAAARFGSSLVFGMLWVNLGRGPAVLVLASLLALAIPFAWHLLRHVGVPAGEVVA